MLKTKFGTTYGNEKEMSDDEMAIMIQLKSSTEDRQADRYDIIYRDVVILYSSHIWTNRALIFLFYSKIETDIGKKSKFGKVKCRRIFPSVPFSTK